jgi:hypothetical protein
MAGVASDGRNYVMQSHEQVEAKSANTKGQTSPTNHSLPGTFSGMQRAVRRVGHEPLTADTVRQFQTIVGNQAVQRILAHQQRSPAIQRRLWIYDGDAHRWRESRTGALENHPNMMYNRQDMRKDYQRLGQATPMPGDTWDDTKLEYFGRGQNPVKPGQDVSQQDMAALVPIIKRGVGLAKVKMMHAIRLLTEAAKAGTAVGGPVKMAMDRCFLGWDTPVVSGSSSITLTPAITAHYQRQLLEVVARKLSLTLDGLSTSRGEFIIQGGMSWFQKWFNSVEFGGIVGWVTYDSGFKPEDRHGEDVHHEHAGEINITSHTISSAGKDDQGMRTLIQAIVHESTHKFINTADYGYSPIEDKLKLLEAWEKDPNMDQSMRANLGQNVVTTLTPTGATKEYDFAKHMDKNLDNWIRMGIRRHLSNADSYGQFVVEVTKGV